MKKLLASIIIAVALLATPGCTTTGTKPTAEAVVFYTFADTWAVAKSAYEGYAELAVQGKVSAADQADIDAAWNRFRAAFKFSFSTASRNWSAMTPVEIQQLSNDLLTLIRSL